MNQKQQPELLFEFFELLGNDPGFGELIDIWTNVAKLAGNEMKRVLRATTLVAQITLNPMLKHKHQYDQMFADYNKDVQKINAKTEKITDAICKDKKACAEAEGMMFLANPAVYMASSIRDQIGSITPEKIDQFYDETGLENVPLVGPLAKWSSKKAVAAGQFASLTSPYGGHKGGGAGGTPDEIKDPERGLVDRLLGIFLLRNPLAESAQLDAYLLNKRRHDMFSILLEQDEKGEEEEEGNDKDQYQDYLTLLVAIGVNEEVKNDLGDAFVDAHRKFCEALVAQLKIDVKDAVAISNAEKVEDFVKAIQEAESEDLKALDGQSLIGEMQAGVEEILSDGNTLQEFLEASGKTLADFGLEDNQGLQEQDTKDEQPPAGVVMSDEPVPAGVAIPKNGEQPSQPEEEASSEEPKEVPDNVKSNEALRQFLMQAIYDQNLAGERKKIFQGLGEMFSAVWDEVLQGMDENKIEDLQGSPTGDQLYDIIETAKTDMLVLFDELNKA